MEIDPSCVQYSFFFIFSFDIENNNKNIIHTYTYRVPSEIYSPTYMFSLSGGGKVLNKDALHMERSLEDFRWKE